MINLETMSPYLEGAKFDNSLVVQLDRPKAPVVDRLESLCKMVRGKTVLHLGFADHLPLIPKKDAEGRWLHRLLMETASHCMGLDIDVEAVKYIKDEMKIDDVYCVDVLSDPLPEDVLNRRWDFVILGELLEHIDNPVAFLEAIQAKFKAVADNLVITVPNAFDVANLKYLNRNCEFINSDHRYWFTPFTLAKVGVRAGFSVRDMCFAHNFSHTTLLQRLGLKRRPMTHETLIGIFGFEQ